MGHKALLMVFMINRGMDSGESVIRLPEELDFEVVTERLEPEEGDYGSTGRIRNIERDYQTTV